MCFVAFGSDVFCISVPFLLQLKEKELRGPHKDLGLEVLISSCELQTLAFFQHRRKLHCSSLKWVLCFLFMEWIPWKWGPSSFLVSYSLFAVMDILVMALAFIFRGLSFFFNQTGRSTTIFFIMLISVFF